MVASQVRQAVLRRLFKLNISVGGEEGRGRYLMRLEMHNQRISPERVAYWFYNGRHRFGVVDQG